MKTLTKSSFEELDKISFHDLCLKDMSFQFQNQTFTITLEEFDDLLEKYCPLTLVFDGVTKFVSTYPADIEFKPHGCYNAVYTVSQNSFEIKFTLELWRDLPVWELTIGFKNVVVQRTLSEQAIQFKKHISI